MDSNEMRVKSTPGAGRILVVDDEEIVHLTMRRLLEPDGYTIDSAYGGAEALSKIDAGYDLLILDIRMPDLDGIEVLREIRKRQLAIEVLILTGYATLESATQALSYGARAYLMKPIEDIPEFKNKIQEAMHISQLARNNRQVYDAIVSGQHSLLIDGKLRQMPAMRKENKESFQRLMDVMRDGVVFLDFDGNITFANVNFAQMLGESYQKLLEKRFESYVAEEDQDKIVEVLTRLSGGEVAVSIPAQLKTSYGGLLSVIISSSPIYYEMEYRGIVMVISDVTQINRVREKVELLANLVENAQHDMMFIVNSEGQIMECNSLAQSSFGYSRSEMLGLNMKALFKSEVTPGWEKIVDSVKRHSKWRGEILATSRDGKELPAEITVSRPGMASGSTDIICFMRDITERKRAEEIEADAQANAERIEQLEREVRSFEQLSSLPQTSVTAQMFGVTPLRQSAPDTFNELAQYYVDLMELALEQRAYKVEHDVSEGLRSMGEQMGLLTASPRDVVEIHSTSLKKRTSGAAPQKAQAYVEEGRLMVLELMGYLALFYRNYFLGVSKEPTTQTKETQLSSENRKGGRAWL
ncbi:MAG: PAS domain S-box protein [Dehalococcoidia bacterium]|nr:PAS domain S-box protein [Dehalococcoidia bacterium]